MTEYKIVLSNSAGELDCRIVEGEEAIREAILELVTEIAEFRDGDRIEVAQRW